MRFWIAGLCCVVAMMAAGLPAEAIENSADARFKAIYTLEWAWREKQFAGEDNEDSHKELADHLPKTDAATQTMRLRYWQEVMREVDAIPPRSLSRDAQVDYAVYKPQIQALIDDQLFRDYEMPANSDSAFWSDVAMTAQRKLKSAEEYRRYIAFLNDIPRYFREQAADMRAGLARGFTPPKVTMAGRDRSISSIIGARGADNAFYAPFRSMPDTISAADRAALRTQAIAAIDKSVVPAYAALLRFVRDDYVPKCRTTLAAQSLPNGRAYYRAKIREYTTLDLDPAAIHQIGLAEVARIHRRMLEVMHRTGFKGDFPAFLHYLRADPKFYAKTPQELLMRAAWIAKKFDGVASQYFGYLPRERFGIEPVPADIAPFYTSGRGGPGVYYVNTYDLRARPLYNLTALTLHESAPGHAFQIPIAMEQKNQPTFRRETYISAYGEGWAVYSEKLGIEMGIYETPYDVFGMLTYRAWRACRLVVDTGIHSQGWTREQAERYLRDNTALTDHEIETEVDRYISWPGQALSYYLGAMTIEKARARAEKALGSRFNIRAFHDAILKLGSVPLPVIDRRVDRFIADGGRGPYPDME